MLTGILEKTLGNENDKKQKNMLCSLNCYGHNSHHRAQWVLTKRQKVSLMYGHQRTFVWICTTFLNFILNLWPKIQWNDSARGLVNFACPAKVMLLFIMWYIIVTSGFMNGVQFWKLLSPNLTLKLTTWFTRISQILYTINIYVISSRLY